MPMEIIGILTLIHCAQIMPRQLKSVLAIILAICEAGEISESKVSIQKENTQMML